MLHGAQLRPSFIKWMYAFLLLSNFTGVHNAINFCTWALRPSHETANVSAHDGFLFVFGALLHFGYGYMLAVRV